jgi:hypothetical protein
MNGYLKISEDKFSSEVLFASAFPLKRKQFLYAIGVKARGFYLNLRPKQKK